MIRHRYFVYVCSGDTGSALNTLFKDFYAWRVADSKQLVTFVGTYRFNDRLQSFNVSQMIERRVSGGIPCLLLAHTF